MKYAINITSSGVRGYIPEIDGLRAVAVLSVILFHLKANLLPGGFSGVDVFFVISGYVVSGSLAKEHKSSFWQFAVDFYSRRILRIYPALVLCLIISVIFQTLFIPNSWLSTTSIKTGLAAFWGMSNFALILFSDGYFSPRVEFNTFTHTWSLAVEEQFYLLFPVVFFLASKGRERRNWLSTISNWLLPILLVFSFLVSIYQTHSMPDQAYYLLPSRFWELACGAVLFGLNNQQKFIIKSKVLLETSIFVGLLLIGFGFVYSDPKAFPFPWALLPVLGSLFVITGVASDVQKESLIGKFLNNSPIIYIGKISYSLYLWHWPIIVLLKWTIGIDGPGGIWAAVIGTLAASAMSYHYIERPIRQSIFIASKSNWQIVSRGFASVTLVAVAAGFIFIGQPYFSLSVTKDRYNWYPEAEKKYNVVDSSQFYGDVFHGRKIFVLGDSHAGAYGTMLSMLQNETNVSVQIFSKGGCPIANLLRTANSECTQFIEEITKKINSEAKSGDIVFLASLRMNRFGDQWAKFNQVDVAEIQSGPNSSKNRELAFQEANLIIDRFESAGLTVVIDAPKPIFKSPPFRCSDWFNSNNPVCEAGAQISRSELLNHRKPVMDSISKLTSQHPKLVVWDPFSILCPTSTCIPTDNNLPLFFDGDHLSGHGNRILYPSFFDMVKHIFTSTSFDSVPSSAL